MSALTSGGTRILSTDKRWRRLIDAKTEFTEAEVAAEERRLGRPIPAALRRRYLEGMPNTVELSENDVVIDLFSTWAPSTETTNSSGRRYTSQGLASNLDEVRGLLEEYELSALAWATADDGSLALAFDDGEIAVIRLGSGLICDVAVEWEGRGDA